MKTTDLIGGLIGGFGTLGPASGLETAVGGGRGAFYITVWDSNLDQQVNFPTHKKGNTLDLILTNM